MRKNNLSDRLNKILLLTSDVLLLLAGIMIANLLYFNSLTMWISLGEITFIVPISILLVTIVFFYFLDLYADWIRRSISKFMINIILSLLLSSTLTLFAFYLLPIQNIPSIAVYLTLIFQLILIISSRVLYWSVLKHYKGQKNMLIIGSGSKHDGELVYEVLNHNKGWFIIQNFIPVYNEINLIENIQDTDIVLLCPSLSYTEKSEIISQCSSRGIEVMVIPELTDLFILESSPQQIDDTFVLSIKPVEITSIQRHLKRTFDLLISSFIIVLCSPIFLVLFIIIPLSSKGPALYKQERLGENEKPYHIYKFRSMVEEAERLTGPALAIDNDPRITRVGRWIRATRLDELPQLFNIIKGDMSLVGPRPERAFFINQFRRDIPNYSYRMSVKPGLTGLAQTLSNYTTSVEDKLRYDVFYIKNYSLPLDLKILIQTLSVMLQRNQAEGIKKLDKDLEDKLKNVLDQKDVEAITQTR
ncbi:sugar transferase [Pseudalkalibacillus sp. NRS-1564]|uniref:sugar transferase n=1 Tax=Pseudalkalibacillus sp. NRS-1564 TaxID=3233900 RepID=UPI003D2DB92D